jgi:hypothetical protein
MQGETTMTNQEKPHTFDDSPAVSDQSTAQLSDRATEARDQVSQAGQQLSRVMTEGKNRAANGLHHLAGVLRDTTPNLGQNDAGVRIATYRNRAAARIDAMSTYMRDADVSTMIGDAGRFARRPEVLLAGTVLTGLFVARLLKASRHPAPQPWTSAGRWRETLQKGTQAVSMAADTVKHGAKARGLNPEALVEKVTRARLGRRAAGSRLWGKS